MVQKIYSREDYILFDKYFKKWIGGGKFTGKFVSNPDHARIFHGAYLKNVSVINSRPVNEYRLDKV